jgi:hypothetical protein
MKPNPLASLNHFTFPFAIVRLPNMDRHPPPQEGGTSQAGLAGLI